MINEGTNYVRSPLLASEPEGDELEGLAGDIEDEIESLITGTYQGRVTDENLAIYARQGFEDSVSNDSPEWWRPTAATTQLDVEDPTVEEWYHRAISELKGDPDYRLREDQDIDNMTGEAPPLKVVVADREQKSEKVTIEGDNYRELVDLEQASQILAEKAPERGYSHDRAPTIDMEHNGNDVSITPDLSSGFFESEIKFGANTYDSHVWMPYADKDQAILLSPPSQFNPDATASVVPVSETSFTGDPMIDAVSETLSYVLPFEGIHQREVSSEAIDYRNENPLSAQPFSQQILEDAWNRLNDLDQEYRDRVMDELDKISLRPGTSPLDTKKDGKITQIGSEDIYMKYKVDQESETIQLKDIMDRKETFTVTGDNRRT